jgi:hypothetical protein
VAFSNPYAKEAARIFLKITDVSAQRLHDITPDECFYEGIQPTTDGIKCPEDQEEQLVYNYMNQWNEINDRRGFGWDENPWVWVYSFEKFKENIR